MTLTAATGPFSTIAKLLHATGSDVRLDLLEDSPTTTRCAYKGLAS